MGMTIAEPIQTLEYLRNCGVFPFSTVDEVLYTVESIDVAIDTMRKYQQMQADYETRIKSDMVAMLEDLKKEIKKLDTPYNNDAYMTCSEVIQQKINALKGEGEE